jgi:hypothetical protein
MGVEPGAGVTSEVLKPKRRALVLVVHPDKVCVRECGRAAGGVCGCVCVCVWGGEGKGTGQRHARPTSHATLRFTVTCVTHTHRWATTIQGPTWQRGASTRCVARAAAAGWLVGWRGLRAPVGAGCAAAASAAALWRQCGLTHCTLLRAATHTQPSDTHSYPHPHPCTPSPPAPPPPPQQNTNTHTQAYETLSDEDARYTYDWLLQLHRSGGGGCGAAAAAAAGAPPPRGGLDDSVYERSKEAVRASLVGGGCFHVCVWVAGDVVCALLKCACKRAARREAPLTRTHTHARARAHTHTHTHKHTHTHTRAHV